MDNIQPSTAAAERRGAMSGPDHRCPDCGVVDGCVCGPDDGPLVIPCLRPAGECRDAIAALTSELAEARAERAMFCALVESLTSELAEARRQLVEGLN